MVFLDGKLRETENCYFNFIQNIIDCDKGKYDTCSSSCFKLLLILTIFLSFIWWNDIAY